MSSAMATSLPQLLRSLHPHITLPAIVSAPMRIYASPLLALTVSAAGGLGFIGPGAKPTDLSARLAKVREMLQHPEMMLFLDIDDETTDKNIRLIGDLARRLQFNHGIIDPDSGTTIFPPLPVGVGFSALRRRPPALRAHRVQVPTLRRLALRPPHLPGTTRSRALDACPPPCPLHNQDLDPSWVSGGRSQCGRQPRA